jgi:hypothetical protein
VLFRSRAGALAALRLAFVVGSLAPEPLAAEYLARAVRELSELAVDAPQPADIFLLFQTAQQLALWANAWLAASVFLDLVPRFRYSLDCPPDIVKARRLCTSITEYLDELSEFVPVDPAAVLSPQVDAALLKLREFLTMEVPIQGEFFEAKLTKAITSFNRYLDVLGKIRGRAAAFRWTCDAAEIVDYLEKALAQLSDAAAGLVLTARALLEIEALLQPFDVGGHEFAQGAFIFLGNPGPEKVQESAQELVVKITALKDGTYTATPPNLPSSPEIAVDGRKATLEKVDLLKRQIEVFESGVTIRERICIMIPGGQGGTADPRAARVKSFRPGAMTPLVSPVKPEGK